MYDERLFIDEKCLGGIRLKKNWLSKEEVDKAVREVKLPDEPPLKSWTPSNPNLPIMNKYSKVMSSEYWRRQRRKRVGWTRCCSNRKLRE